MKPRISGLLGVLAALASVATACKKDPTADGVGAPAAVIADFSAFTLSVGDSAKFTATVVDERLTPLDEPITFSSCDNAAATVAVDPTYQPVPPTSARAVIHAVGPNAVCILASSGGAKPDTVHVISLPVSFGGAASTTSLTVGQSLRLLSTAQLKFSGTSDIDFGGGAHGFITTRKADTLTVLIPQPDNPAAGKLTVENVSVTYVPGGFQTNLPTSTTFGAVVNPYGANSNPDPAFTLAMPAVGDSIIFYDGFQSSEADNFYTFTTAATATFQFTMTWPNDADLDLYVCDAGCNNFEGGAAQFNAATSANPEVATMTLPAGSHNLWVNQFATPGNIYQIKIKRTA